MANEKKLESLIIRGARVHNLKNIDLELPHKKLVVITGVSGSGKSSLAFDTIYAEGQRRYVESLSSYARQFLERMDKPDVDMIQGIAPAIAIEQKTSSRNPRSTVATATEIYDYLRLLFGRVGTTYCRLCGEPVKRDSVASVVDRLSTATPASRVYISFPLHDHPGHTLAEEIEAIRKRGFFRILNKNDIIDLNEQSFKPKPKELNKSDISVVIDRLVVNAGDKEAMQRLADSVETAFREGEGYVRVLFPDSSEMLQFTRHYECRTDGSRYEDPDPKMFSFNSPIGACPKCQGFGRAIGVDPSLVVPDPSKSLEQGAIQPWTTLRWKKYIEQLLLAADRHGIPTDQPYSTLNPRQVEIIWQGTKGYPGIRGFIKYLESDSYKIQYRVLLSRYRGYTTCDDCNGARVRSESLNIRVGGKNIHDVVRMTIGEARAFFGDLQLSEFEYAIGRRILDELRKRVSFLDGVGIGYLTLDRMMMTLSGGETQRINLATSLGSTLVGSLYVLDEPSIGLHARDNYKLITMLKKLRDVGNTVIVVEHDEDMIREADVIVDMGPRAGEHGGEVMYVGDMPGLLSDGKTLTAQYLNGSLSIPVPRKRRSGNGQSIVIRGAAEHNLKHIDITIPLGNLVCITGVSGSGKSTLVYDILYAGIKKMIDPSAMSVGRFRAIEGVEQIARIEMVDQSPIGRSPRSNAVTYLKIFDSIREQFASTQMARMRGFSPGHFSFNVPGGRCDTCEGDGVQHIEMQFLADLYLQCESCKGKRYKQEVLEVRYREKNIDDILSMTVTEAIQFFGSGIDGRKVAKKLKVLDDVGLGYIRLGQSATTLSGGEAQRIKLASHINEGSGAGMTLFIFDEPTTGLHFDDIAKLLTSFDALIHAGHSLVVVEHNLHVIKCADHVIDLGPEAGDEGGQIVAEGPPETIVNVQQSHTGRLLKPYLRHLKNS
jgi:excinuclease ABC subunit A